MKRKTTTLLLILILILLPNIFFSLFFSLIEADSKYIERNEAPKDLGLNVLEIYNYKNKPLIFFDGYHQKGVIYLGDFKEIEHLYNYSTLDFVLITEYSGESEIKNLLFTSKLTNIELQDDDNSLAIIDNSTVMFELKRFRFIITENLTMTDDILMTDAQFFVLSDINDMDKALGGFSVEEIFFVGQYQEDHNPIVSVIPEKTFIQFICNSSSYKFQYKKF